MATPENRDRDSYKYLYTSLLDREHHWAAQRVNNSLLMKLLRKPTVTLDEWDEMRQRFKERFGK